MDTKDRTCREGQAIIEFAIASLVFMLIVFGTIDFGRAIFQYSVLHNAVREGARAAKVECNAGVIQARVQEMSPAVTLSSVNVSGCGASGTSVTVSAESQFQAVTQNMLGISPITLRSSATVYIE